MRDREHIIRHALTGGTGHVFRRHFVVTRGTEMHLCLQGMVDDGLMEGPDKGDRLLGFRVTAAGAASVGLHLPDEPRDA